MDYEKHVKKLVLGYLKKECTAAYKVFLKNNFQNHNKPISTRVLGHTLEDILRVHSKVYDIVQARLEDTPYYKENGEASFSPFFLAEQVLYLLDRDRPISPSSNIDDRSVSRCCSIVETYNRSHDVESHHIDVEATPEHTLPGNISNTEEDSRHSHTSYRQNEKLVQRISYLDTLADPELTTAMSEKLLHNTDLMQKLAQNINTARENNNSNTELDMTIKSAVSRIEADPIFENLMQTFLEPVEQTMTKQNNLDPRTSPSSSSTAYSTAPANNRVDDQMNGAVSSLLAVSNTNASSNNKTEEQPNTTMHKEVNPNSEPNTVVTTTTTVTSSVMQGSFQTQNSDFNRYPIMQPPQYFIVNPSLMIPHANQLLTLVQPFKQNNRDVAKIQSKAAPAFTQEDITTMPTIILNDRNELSACLDPSGITLNTPHKINEVHNITEYLNVFGQSDQSPIIINTKETNRNKRILKSKPTVEVFNRQSTPLKVISDITIQYNEKQLPNLETVEPEETATQFTSNNTGSVINEKDKSLTAVCTPSQIVSAVKKPTPKSGSHVRNLSFPSPFKKTSTEKTDHNTPSVANKQQATKDLFRTIPEETTTQKKSPLKMNNKQNKSNEMQVKANQVISPAKQKCIKESTIVKPVTTKSYRLWDESLRKNIIPLEQETNKTPKKPKARNRKSVDLDVTDPDGKILEEALKTPKSKTKTPMKKKVAAKAKTKTIDRTRTNKGEPKMILSQSKVHSTSKKNMDVDGVTPNLPRDGNHQPISNARKNIASLLETPLKDELAMTSAETHFPSANTPFTPMLKANLKDFTEGDNFSIDTPNFPVTPGLNLIEASAASYCILKDTETNKQTEADLLSEERKSSVRKTDDEDFVLSPKVYGCKKHLDHFNKSMAGKKDLELLDNKGVQWEERSDMSTSNSGDETNNTVIQQVDTPQPALGRRSLRIAGKSMSALKSKFMEMDSENIVDSNDEAVSKDISGSDLKDDKSLKKVGASSSSDSEIISLAQYKSREGIKKIENNNKKRRMAKIPESCIDEDKSSETNNHENGKDLAAISSTESIRKTLDKPIESHYNMTDAYSLKAEIDEKRRRIIKQEKSPVGRKTPGRRSRIKAKPNIPNSTSEKRTSRKSTVTKDSESEIPYSQDEFFKQSGSNLHRTNTNSKKFKQDNGRKATSAKAEDGTDGNKKHTETHGSGIKEHIDFTNESHDSKTLDESSKELDLSAWDDCVLEEQLEVKHIIYDEESSLKPVIDRRFSLDNKQIQFFLPIEDGGLQTITATAVDFESLLDIASEIDEKKNPRVRCSTELSSDSEHIKVADDAKCSKKRKNRSDSCSSNSSKRIKSTIIPREHGKMNTAIQKVLNQLHGPNEKS